MGQTEGAADGLETSRLLVEKQEHQGEIILSWRPRPQNTAPPGTLPESGQRTLKDEMLAPGPGEEDPFT